MPTALHIAGRCQEAQACQSGRSQPSKTVPLHGGASPGAPRGKANGSYKHGRFTAEAIESRRGLNALIRKLRRVAEQVG